ncbi:RagB/SusD family nutrient uptake outer membrane protein [uncultured Draconibacterium sp.]|uniref:RagB/SusD family nutrient uptake outer membrane protein n=1 Tax=uncultured Draconibacterium sp. TaxID=1573823 RepID=UPI0032172136
MNKYINKYTVIVTVVLSVFILASCEDFLEVAPESSLTGSTFFKTDGDFEQAANAAYEQLQMIYGRSFTDNPGEGSWIMGEMRSDNTCFIYNTGNRGFEGCEQIDYFIDDYQNGFSFTKYYRSFILINRTNQILAQLETADITESVANNVKGQALFLRALTFFDLVQYFGDVPMPLTPAKTMDETSLPRTERSVIINQIIDDATLAASLLPAKSSQGDGRATSGAANMLLANVYMVLEDWSGAETKLKGIVASDEYELLSSYESIYDISNKNHAESIFEVQYMQGATQGLYSNFIYNFLPRLDDPSIVTGVAGSANSQGGWNTPTPDIIASYEEGDLRKAASIDYVNGYPYIKKYLHAHSTWNNTDDNWPVYRYAETLLDLAEALNEQAKSSEALPYLNEVRSRAGLDDISTTNQSELRDAIMHERRVELAFENKRWPDLVRTGTAIEVMQAHGEAVLANPQAYYYPEGYTPASAAFTDVNEFRLVFPIPYRELQLNSELTQNPGY